MGLKVIFRNFQRHRLNSSIIIISLAIGIACMNLIAIFISKENNADSFQKNRDHIYALQADDPFSKGKMYFIRYGAAEYMKDNFAEVQDFCRVANSNPIKVNVEGQDYFDNPKVITASANFFSFFSYSLQSNAPEKVLNTKQDIVVSENFALKYFHDPNPVGRKITLVNRDSSEDMTVSGVFRKPDESTQINFDMVRLIGENDSRCYLLLSPGAGISQLEEKFSANRENIPIVNDGKPGTHYLKSMKAAYFDPLRRQTVDNHRDKADLMIALVIGLMILGVALFNYLGLVNNRLMEKARENSIRRVNGGSKVNLITGFISETLMLVGISFIFSLALMVWALPFFNGLTASSILTSYIFGSKNILLLTAIPVFVLLASLLFAYFRIGKKIGPEMLKPGKAQPADKFRIPVFNVAQLAVSMVLIIGSIFVMKQINYITNKKMGLNKDVLEVKIPQQHKDLALIFKAELEKNPSVELVSVAQASPVLEHYMLLLPYQENGIEKKYTPSVFVGDENYTKVLGVKIIEGEDFYPDAESNKNKCVINESLAALFPNQDLIGKKLPGSDNNVVIGICNDFHYSSLKRIIEPGYIAYSNNGFYLMVKPVENQSGQAREVVAAIWDKLIADFPLNMESIGDRYEWMHRENSNYAKLIGACCLISIFLSMIGLFAVSYHSSRRRIKEIGIRKVNGARVPEILSMLNRDYVAWVFIACVVAMPAGWFAMHKWLESFAYKTSLSWWVFVLAGIIALGIALLTVSFQSWRAATRNPVEALRYE